MNSRLLKADEKILDFEVKIFFYKYDLKLTRPDYRKQNFQSAHQAYMDVHLFRFFSDFYNIHF